MSETTAPNPIALPSRRTRPQRLGRIEQGIAGIRPGAWLTALVLLVMPVFADDFFQYQIFGWTFVFGTIGMSFMFLAGYGGMVSLAQMTTAGLSGYLVAILGSSAYADISLGWPWWAFVPVAILAATVFGTLVGIIAIRTQGIYMIMITLAIAAAFYYFCNQNLEVFNGQRGFNSVLPPQVLGVDWHRPTPFYYLSLGVAAAAFGLTRFLSRSTFCLAVKGVRDDPRRMASLGFSVPLLRILAFAYASFIAAVAGILVVWFNGQISPGTASVNAAIDILVIAVVGGLGHPIGPYIGALVFILLRTFAIDLFHLLGFTSLRFNLLVGVGFLAIVAFSPDGVIGLWQRWRGSILRPRR